MRRGSCSSEKIKLAKVKSGTLGTIEHYFKIKDLQGTLGRTLLEQIDKAVEKLKLDSAKTMCYSASMQSRTKGIPKGLLRCYNDRSLLR
jgi:hypothetical protein